MPRLLVTDDELRFVALALNVAEPAGYEVVVPHIDRVLAKPPRLRDARGALAATAAEHTGGWQQ